MKNKNKKEKSVEYVSQFGCISDVVDDIQMEVLHREAILENIGYDYSWMEICNHKFVYQFMVFIQEELSYMEDLLFELKKIEDWVINMQGGI